MSQKELLPITEYFPQCEVHGFMNFTQLANRKRWQCNNKSCKEQREYLTQVEFLKMVLDALEDVDNFDDAHYELIFFSHLLYVDIEIIYEVLMSYQFSNITDWKKIIALINEKCEMVIRSNNQKYEKKVQLEKYLENKKRENFRVCLLCGTSRCKSINNCMVTSN